MKKLIIPVVLAAAGFLTYKFAFASSAAYKAYVRFADSMLYDRWDEARELAGSDDVKEVIDDAEAQPAILGREMYRSVRGTVQMGPYRSVEAESPSADGKRVTLRVVQEERRGAVTMAPIGPPNIRHKQDVVMVLTPKGWLVGEFDEEVESLTGVKELLND